MVILDYKDRRPLYEQVVEKLKELIYCGVLEEHTQLPTVRSLAMELSINPNTIQRAYAQLEREGVIYSIKGKGSFAAPAAGVRRLQEKEFADALGQLANDAQRMGITKERFVELAVQVYEASPMDGGDADGAGGESDGAGGESDGAGGESDGDVTAGGAAAD
ncbi:MAG: GntR family transcriptional regulator [Lachnospiraceae bacterium]|jgi:GntR family transcriptional regulator|nr:GntR family transcriptional regulator [Lachnospiraceae bacterium]